MIDFANALADFILARETPKLDNIMAEVANKIQNDVVEVTYSVIDAFYQDYKPKDGRVYIRTDELHNKRRNDKFRKKSQKETLKKRSRRNDVSLKTALKAKGKDQLGPKVEALSEGSQPAIGVCQKVGTLYYQAGVLFDEDKISKRMKHTIKGFDEWDIVEDFLWGVHGNEGIFTTEPSAGWVLYEYINSYKPRFDQHYKAACKKFKNN